MSGKGAPAALYAALVSGILRSLARDEPYPAEMLHAVNRSLNQRRLDAQYLVLTCALWDDEKKTMRVANSGLRRALFTAVEATPICLKPPDCRWACLKMFLTTK